MNKLVDYRRNGPGVRKTQRKTYTMSDFWHTYFAKFFKLLGLNVIYFVFFALVALLCYIPLNRVLDRQDPLKEKLQSYSLDSSYTTMATSYCEAYKFDDTTLDHALPYLKAALDRIKTCNPDLLKDGMSGYNSKKYTAEDKAVIAENFGKAMENLSFSLTETETGVFELTDKSDRIVATCTVTENAVELDNSLPRSLSDLVRILVCLAPVILLSPVHLAIFRVTRDYVQGTPSFMLSDLWDTVKKNWWQSLVIGVLTYLGFSLVGVSLIWYWSYFYNGFFFKIGLCLCLVLAYILLSMSFYVGIMQVSLDMRFGNILKNAFFFSVICLWRNLLMILVTAFMIVFIVIAYFFGMANPLVMSLTFTLLLIAYFGFWFFFISFMTYPSVLKYIVDPYYEGLKKKEQEAETVESEPAEEKETESEYVYYNGRMVHRSVLEQESLFTDDTTENE